MKRAFLTAIFMLSFFAGAFAADRARERRQKIDEGLAAYQEKNYDAAAAAFERARELEPTRTEQLKLLPWLGRAYEAQSNYQRALTVYEEARDLRPRDIDRILDLARVYGQVDLNAQAIELYQQVLRKGKNRRDVIWALALVYAKDLKWSEARAAAETYLAKEPQDVVAQGLMARIEENLGNAGAAAKIREGILASSPTPAGFILLGRLWSRENELELAANAFDRAEKAGARGADFWFERGVLSWRQNKKDQAAIFWNKALAADPGCASAQFLLALADEDARRPAAAAARVKKIAGNPGGHDLKNWVEVYEKSREAAPPPQRQP